MDSSSKLADLGIRLRSTSEGEHRTLCPICTPQRKRPEADLAVKIDSEGLVAVCFHCGWKTGFRHTSNEDLPDKTSAEIVPIRVSEGKAFDPSVEEYLKIRGISAETLKVAGVYSHVVSFPDGPKKCIAFPYRRQAGGPVVGVKYRSKDKRFLQERGSEQIFWGLDRIQAPAETLVITEGEIDALSLLEAGIPNVLSVPGGAPQKVSPGGKLDPAEDKKFAFVWDAAELLNAARRIILAVDGDGPGQALEEELSRRLGKDKCWRVTWPTGTKDANEVLVRDGPEGLRAVLDAAIPYPIKALVEPESFRSEILGLYRDGRTRGLKVGYPGLDDLWTFRPGELTVLTGVPNQGKALALDTLVPTPSGWTTMGEIKIGDTVFSETGTPTKVIAVSPVMEGRPCFRLEFNNGLTVIADRDHKWLTASERSRRSLRNNKRQRGERQTLLPRGNDQRHKRTYPSLVTTGEVAASVRESGKYNHQISVCRPIQTEERPLLIPPYTLGAWLGDGNSANCGLTSFDQGVLDFVRWDGFEVRPRSTPGHYGILGLGPLLRSTGLIRNKMVPPEYLRTSVSQRLSLLQGLMDTDGCVSKETRQCEFTSTNKALADGVYELASSLGIIASLGVGRATLYGRDISAKYRVTFTTHLPVFRLPRKMDALGIGKRRKSESRPVMACDPVESVPVRCIQVDGASSQFLITKAFIPTHNSELCDQIMVNLSESYGLSWAVCSWENPPADHLTKLIEKHLRKPFLEGGGERLTEGEIDFGLAWVGEHFHLIQGSDEPQTIEWVLETARAAVMRFGIRGLVIDPYAYLEKDLGQGSETESVASMLRKVKKFSVAHAVHVLFVCHPQKLYRDKSGKTPVPGAYDLMGSSHWANLADNILAIARDYETGEVDLYVRKVRFKATGTTGACRLGYDKITGVYYQGSLSEPLSVTEAATIEPTPIRDMPF